MLPPQQHSMPSLDNVSKVTMDKADSRRKEFYVHDQQGAEVYNFCSQFDVTGSSNHSGSLVLAPTQQFPAHTLRTANPGQLQLYNRSLHPDTSSSICSGTPSIHSAGSAGDRSGMTPSAGSRLV